jgi:hypothetical protein
VSTPGSRRWTIAGIAGGVCLSGGSVLQVVGVAYRLPVPYFVGLALVGLGVAVAAFILRAWVAWHRAHGTQVCLVYQVGLFPRVRHLHWPKDRIVTCTKSAGFHVRRSQ